jgi:hypothetical protein
MYFWKINDLKKLIVERGLSEAQIFYYVLLFVGLSVAGIEFTAYFPSENPNGWTYVQSGLNLFIPVTGTVAAYHGNRGAEGTAFAAKYFSISLVMLVRFFVYLIPVMVVLFVYYGLSIDWSSPEAEDTFETGWFEVVLISAWSAALYARIVKHIRDTANA